MTCPLSSFYSDPSDESEPALPIKFGSFLPYKQRTPPTNCFPNGSPILRLSFPAVCRGGLGGEAAAEWRDKRRRDSASGVQRRAEAAVGEVGVGDPGAEEEVAHLARLVPDAGDGG